MRIEDSTDPLKVTRTRRSQPRGRPREKLESQIVLEGSHVATQPRLRQSQFPRRTREVEVLGQRLKLADIVEHAPPNAKTTL